MKQRIWVMLFVLSVATTAFAQEGYKEYRWGMSVQQVTAIAGELNALDVKYRYFEMPQVAALYLYGELFDYQVPDLMAQEDGKVSWFAPEGSGDGYFNIPPISFWFVDDELVGVELTKFDTSILSDLRLRYGVPGLEVSENYGVLDIMKGVTGTVYEFEVIAWENGDRDVVWEKPKGNSNAEKVAYLDKIWILGLVSDLQMQLREKEFSDQKRLD